ncbi:MAG: hypothetical protein O2999_00525 [Nitrospirae bacterium]|nr:hypothetical protein [Nitrospirota bacterium]MDA1302790.1 hypothetical protein [Nitrospirota bacterium]
MKSQTLPKFWDSYARLPEEAKQAARKAFHLWRNTPFHPSLHFKCVNRKEGIWSARITIGYRALGILDGDTITWFWIGNHQDYERRF